MKQKVLNIDVSTKSFSVEDIDDESVFGPVDFGLRQYENSKDNFITVGKGVLTGSIIPGTKRLIFCAKSPIWSHFYISTMGGAANVFHHIGIDYVKIVGQCEKYNILEIKNKKGNIIVKFHEIDVENVWEGYKDKIGVYALQEFVYDELGKNFTTCRILSTGPASQKTNNGAIASAPIEKGEITSVDCWAGRGGIGSKLVQDHKIVSIIYGGDFVDPVGSPLRDFKVINEIFLEKFNKKLIEEDLEVTKKYRYDPAFHSGGTFGVNFTRIGGWMFSFNYQSVNFSEEDRLRIHKEFIVNHYLKQFNEETIEKRQFKHCGEPCAALCKKMRGEFKKDYEPYEALGPNCGIFDQRAAEKINHYVDSMGFDAIQIGSVVSWIMECIIKKKFPKEDFGFDKEPKWDYNNFDVVSDSNHNAEVGCEIIRRILTDDRWVVFRKGIRSAAKDLDEKYNTGTIHLAVFNAFGEEGCIVPNQYWVPGMFSPMPIMGKYFEYYNADFLPPYELGLKNSDRMIHELYSDNTGLCRFHRGWIEELIQEIVNHLLETNIHYYNHHKKLAQRINLGNKPVFWESERVVDIVKGYLEKIEVSEPENPERDVEGEKKNEASINEWVKRFKVDKWGTAKQYWQLILDGINKGFE